MIQAKAVSRMVGTTYIALLLFFCLTTSSCSFPKFIIIKDPLSPEEHVNLGLAYEKKGETENAVAEYKKASKELPVAFLYLGNIYFEKGDLSQAEKYYRKTIREEPGLSGAYNNLAWLLYTRGENLEEALALSQKALELEPSNESYKDTFSRISELIKENRKRE